MGAGAAGATELAGEGDEPSMGLCGVELPYGSGLLYGVDLCAGPEEGLAISCMLRRCRVIDSVSVWLALERDCCNV